MKKQYFIRRERDSRIIAGIFVPINSQTIAENVLKQWKHNFPSESFHITEN